MSRILLVDISGIAYAIWHVSGKELDQDYVSKTAVARIHQEARSFDHTVICCDGPKNFRKDIAPSYKANRESNEVVKHQLRLAQEQLAEDGFLVLQAEGFEADDVIASAVAYLRKNLPLEDGKDEVVILSADKDLMTQVGAGVKVKSPNSGNLYDREEVREKFGVYPERIADLLCMMGDKSDNVPGIDGIGKVTGAKLLNEHGSLFELYQKLGNSCTVLGLTPRMFSLLKDNLRTVELARKLITLRTDVDLPFEDIFKPRMPRATLEPLFGALKDEDDMQTVDGEIIDETTGEVQRRSEPPPKQTNVVDMPKSKDIEKDRPAFENTSRALAPVEWSQSLEPQNLAQALNLAKAVFASRQFAAYGTPEAVLLAIMAGRELGISTMAALRSIHIIEGKPTMSAALMAGLVLRSKSCKQFEVIERTNERATIRIWREGWEKPRDVSYSVDDAKRAGRVKQGSGWEKNPADMCVARCQAIGARLGWPDILANVYLADELGREEAA